MRCPKYGGIVKGMRGKQHIEKEGKCFYCTTGISPLTKKSRFSS